VYHNAFSLLTATCTKMISINICIHCACTKCSLSQTLQENTQRDHGQTLFISGDPRTVLQDAVGLEFQITGNDEFT